MDIGTAYFISLVILILGVLGIVGKGSIWLLFPFIGVLLGMLFMVTLNSDGSIVNAYAYSGGFQTSTTGIFPFFYVPLLFTILDGGVAFWKAIESR